MSKYKLLLLIAAALVLFTFLGHTIGAFQMNSPQEVDGAQLVQLMEQTMMPMPIGSPKSYMDLYNGSNFGLSVYLLISGLSLILFARSKDTQKPLIVLTGVGLALMTLLCVRYFFPLPTICLGLASILAFAAARIRA